MKTGEEKSKSKNKKKVSFSAIETMEKTTDSIERLASLTLRVPHMTMVAISYLVKKDPLQELLSATKSSMRLV